MPDQKKLRILPRRKPETVQFCPQCRYVLTLRGKQENVGYNGSHWNPTIDTGLQCSECEGVGRIFPIPSPDGNSIICPKCGGNG